MKEFNNVPLEHTNKEYQGVCNISERTATRDLSNLVSLGLFMQIGVTGKGTEYILTRHKDAKDAIKTPSGQSTCLPWRESLPAEALAKVGEGVRGKQVSSPTLEKGGKGGFWKNLIPNFVAPSFIACLPVGRGADWVRWSVWAVAALWREKG